MVCETTTVAELDPIEASWIASRMTIPSSEMQQEMLGTREAPTPISIVLDQGEIIGWAATHQWRGQQTLEVYTAPEYRRRGVARFAAAALVASGAMKNGIETAVFRGVCCGLAASVGLVPVLYRRDDHGWHRAAF